MSGIIGSSTIDELFTKHLQVDAKWAVRSEDGFTWWADNLAQRIRIIGHERGPAGEQGWYVSVMTDVAREIELDDETATVLNAVVMPFAAMGGWSTMKSSARSALGPPSASTRRSLNG
jgi:hypothetical protein